MRALVAALLRRLATMIDGPIVIVLETPTFDQGTLVKAASEAAAQATKRTNGYGASARY